MRNVIFGILFLLLMSGTGFAGLSITDYSISQESYAPGSQGTVTIYISNPSSCPSLPGGCSEDHRLTEVGVSITAPPQITISERQDIGDIEIGGSTFVTLPFSISDEADSGVYSLKFRVFSYAQTAQTRYITIPITVANIPQFVFTPEPNVLTGVDAINMVITNEGGIAKKMEITVGESESGVALFGTNQIYIGTLEDEATVEMMLDARDAEDGPVNVPLVVKYDDELGVSHEETHYVRMTVNKEKLDVTFDQMSDVITRKESSLVLGIKNNGDEYLKDIKLEFMNDSMKLSDGTEFDYGDIAPGEEITVSGTVFATLSPGLNLVPAKVTWIENDIHKDEMVNVPITITSDADVGVYIETKPAPLMAGQEHTLSVLISNLGSYQIDNVDVEIESEVFDTLDITNKQYIGSLKNDDFSTVQFKVIIDPLTMPGDYTMTVKVTYRDQSGEWETRYINQPITVHSAVSADYSLFLYGGILIIAIILAWFFFFRKKKKRPE